MHAASQTADDGLPATRVRLGVAGWLAVMAALAYLCRLSISVAAKSIRADLDLTEEQLGWILGPAFFWTYAFAQIPSSRLGERLGARLSLPLFACTWSLATASFGIGKGFAVLLAIWMILGLAQAGAFPVAMRTFAVWFPQSERASASGSLVAMMSVGAAVGAGVTGTLLLWLPWQSLFVLYAIPGVIWAIAFSIWFRNSPAEHAKVNAAELQIINEGRGDTPSHSPESVATPWLALLTSWPMWLICGQQFCRAAAMVFFGTWFPTFLQESRHITVTKSGLLTILPYLAMAFACLVGGAVADAVFRRTGRLDWSRKGLAVTSLVLSTGLIFLAYLADDATTAVVIISTGIFVAGLAAPCAYTVTLDLGGRHAGAVFATMNMVGNIGAGLFPIVVPVLREALQSTPMLLSWCAGDTWNAVVLLIALLHLTAAICWMGLPLGKNGNGERTIDRG